MRASLYSFMAAWCSRRARANPAASMSIGQMQTNLERRYGSGSVSN
jgi:hypothetical protein